VEGAALSGIYDLAVIGGGPAGTSAAITAAQLGFRALLLDAGSFPRHKVCGEFISGEAFSILESLLCSDALFANVPNVCKARIFVDDHVAALAVSPPASSVSRYELDLALWQKAIDAGVGTCERTAVRDVLQEGEFFTVITENDKVKARAVIDASGRWSKLRRVRPASGNHWIGLKGHFYEAGGSDSCDLYFFRGGYCGIQPLANGRVNAAAMVRPDVARSLAGVFSQNSELNARSRNWRAASETVSTAPLFFAAPRTNDRGMALAGDAAAFIDPFAGDGISIALHSGRMATLALSQYVRGECSLSSALEAYDRQYRELIQPALTNAARLRRLLHLPKALQVTAVSLLKFPPIARVAVQRTRVRKAG
jgi:flavin-dependent dehydrogenase